MTSLTKKFNSRGCKIFSHDQTNEKTHFKGMRDFLRDRETGMLKKSTGPNLENNHSCGTIDLLSHPKK